MKILFVHQNFPGQFKYLAPALAASGHEVWALTLPIALRPPSHGVRIFEYRIPRGSSQTVHPWLADIETKVIRGEACFRAALELKRRGLNPDVIVAHPGWGESLFLKDVWPESRLGIYAEFYYKALGADTGFDPEFSHYDETTAARLRIKNVNSELHMKVADAGLSPTEWQASTFPDFFRERITVAHDGVDTSWIQPCESTSIELEGGIQLSRKDEVITYFARSLEPYRGYHCFMRALPALLRRRPNAHVLIIGDSSTSYGRKPNLQKDGGQSWKDIYINEIRGQIPDRDWARVHFTGRVPHAKLLEFMQISSVHVYLTYPFVLSWSMIEAMSARCCIVASNTSPVVEVIQDRENGILVDFFDADALVEKLDELLNDPATRERLGAAARSTAVARYDLVTKCLPAQREWVERLASS